MTPKQFWRTSPRKFAALCRVHEDVNTPADQKKKKKEQLQADKPMYIDQIW